MYIFGTFFNCFEITKINAGIAITCFSVNYLLFYGFYDSFPLQYSACAFNLSSQQVIQLQLRAA